MRENAAGITSYDLFHRIHPYVGAFLGSEWRERLLSKFMDYKALIDVNHELEKLMTSIEDSTVSEIRTLRDDLSRLEDETQNLGREIIALGRILEMRDDVATLGKKIEVMRSQSVGEGALDQMTERLAGDEKELEQALQEVTAHPHA